jgi:hypothetical protein
MPITVPFVEHEESPIETGNRDGDFQFTRIFVTAWDDRWNFVNGMFTGGPIGLPMIYGPGFPGVFADTFSIDKIAPNPRNAIISDPQTSQLSHNGEAKITIGYKPMVPTEDGTLISYEMQEQGEFVTVPSRGLKWASDNTALSSDVQAAYATTTTRHVITWSQVVNPPWMVLSQCINHVNSVPFFVPVTKQLMAAGTLLFAEKSASISLNTLGRTTWKLTLTFLEKAQTAYSTTGGAAIGGTTVYGWNWQWREDIGDFDRPVSGIGNGYTFQETDLRRIFV